MDQPLSRTEFDGIYDRYKGLVFKYAFCLTRDRAEAEEIFQEAWLRVVRNYSSIRGGPERLKPWLCAIVSNLHKDGLRRKQTRAKIFEGGAWAAAARSSEGDVDAVDASPGPEQAAENAALAERLRRALDALPERQRRVFVLKEVEGLRQEEIAELLGLPLGTVKSLGFRAVRTLRLKLSESIEVQRKNPCDVGILSAF